MNQNNLKILPIIIIPTIFVIGIFIFGYGLEFFYDDFITLKKYSIKELIDSLSNSWSLDRLENPGYRPFFNYIYHFLWIYFGSNHYLYTLLQIFLISIQGFLIYRLFKLFNNDKLLIYILTLLVLIFSDQFLWRIFIVEIPSLISSLLVLSAIIIILTNYNHKRLFFSYIFLLIATLIKEVNFLFIFTPLVVTILHNHKRLFKSGLIQLIFLSLFSLAFLSMRNIVVNQVPIILQTHNELSINKTIKLLINFVLEFSPSLGLNRFSGIVVILLIAIFFLYQIYKIGPKKLFQLFKDLPTKAQTILFLFIFSMGSFPFYSAGRLRGIFVIMMASIFVFWINHFKYNRKYILFFLCGLILINGFTNISLTKRYKREKSTISSMIYFNPMYRNSIYRGKASSHLSYLEKDYVNPALIQSYSKMIDSIEPKKVKIKSKFVDNYGIEFIQLIIDGVPLNIMKYEFTEKYLNGFSEFYFLKGIPDMPIHGAWRAHIINLINYLNKKSDKYNYRLPTAQEYTTIAGGFSSVYETPLQKFDAKDIKTVKFTPPNKFGIHGLYGNVNEWTSNDLNPYFGVLFGGDAHFGAHNILFADQSQHLDGHHGKLYGFRLIAYIK